MSTTNVTKAIDSFLKNVEPKAIALTGNWGRGKTFFWNSVIKQQCSDRPDWNIKYAYVSLFGISSLSELREAIFENAVASEHLAQDNTEWSFGKSLESLEEAIGDKDLGKLAKTGDASFRKSFTLLESLPVLNKLGPFARSAAFLSVRRYVICFDDLERRANGLAIKEVFGLISLLTEQRQCKVIAILNTDALSEEDRKQYDAFREKVFHFEIKYDPNPSDCSNLVFGSGDSSLVRAGVYSRRLGITNIRILQRIKSAIETLTPYAQNLDNKVLEQIISSSVILCWCYNNKEGDAPPYDYIKNLGYADFISTRDNERGSLEEKWKDILTDYRYRTSDSLDLEICFFLENGYVAEERFKNAAAERSAAAMQERAQGAFSDIWDLYHGSFRNNQDELLETITLRLRDSAKWISLNNVNGVISLLRELKEDTVANTCADIWIDANRPAGDRDLESYGLPIDAIFKGKLLEFMSASEKRPTLAEIISKISDDTGWRKTEEQVLAEAKIEDYYDFFISTEGKQLHSYVKACLRFGTFANASEQQLLIAQKAEAALQKLATASQLNRVRVSSFGIKLPEENSLNVS